MEIQRTKGKMQKVKKKKTLKQENRNVEFLCWGAHCYRENVWGKWAFPSVLEEMWIQTSKTEMHRSEKNKKDKTEIQELWDIYKRCNIHIMGIHEGE